MATQLASGDLIWVITTAPKYDVLQSMSCSPLMRLFLLIPAHLEGVIWRLEFDVSVRLQQQSDWTVQNPLQIDFSEKILLPLK